MRFAKSTDLRVDEIAHQKIEDMHMEGGKFGLGYDRGKQVLRIYEVRDLDNYFYKYLVKS